MPLYRRLPKRGFKTINKSKVAKINLDKIQYYIKKKTINPKELINHKILKKLKIVNKNSQFLKILGNGDIKDKINIEADLISKSAKEKLKKNGGSVQIRKNNKNT